MQGMQTSGEKIAVDLIIAQINVTRDNKEEYVLIYGEEKFKNCIANLLCQLPGHQSSSPSSGSSTGDGRVVGNRAVEDLTNVQSVNNNDGGNGGGGNEIDDLE